MRYEYDVLRVLGGFCRKCKSCVECEGIGLHKREELCRVSIWQA